MAQGYWERYRQNRRSRRVFLAGGATTLAGLGALIAGCSSSNNNKSNGGAAPAANSAAGTAAPSGTRAGTAPGTPSIASAAAGTAIANAKRGGTFRISTLDPSRGFDPGVDTLVPVLHNPKVYSKTHLYQVSTDKIFRDMATSIEQPDATTLVIKIRPDIKFHNVAPMSGRLLTSEDMAYTYKRFPDLVKNKSSTLNPLAFNWIDVNALQTPDKTTIIIKQTSPFADALRLMGQPFFGVVAKEAVDANGGDLQKTPTAGSGAYIPTQVDVATSIKYTRNPNYFSHDHTDPYWFPPNGPFIDTWEQRVIADPTTTQAAVISGDLDTIYFNSLNVDKALATDLKSKPNLKLTQALANDHVAMATAMAHFHDVRLRQALMLAIDYDGFINTVYLGEGKIGAPLGNGFPESLRLPEAELKKYLKFDAKQAKQLWDAAGGNQVVPKIVLLSIANYPFMEQATAFLKQSFQTALGANVDVQASDIPGWLGRVNGQKDWDFYVFFDQSNPDVPTTNALNQYNPAGAGPRTEFKLDSSIAEVAAWAKQADALDKAQAQELDASARTQKLYDLQRFYLQNAIPAVPLPGRQFWNVITNKRVNNIPEKDSTLWNNCMVENIWLDPTSP